jgi:hypothetical protein
VLFPVRSEDDITGIELYDLLAPGLDQAAALGDVQGLAAVVGIQAVRAPGVKCTAARFSAEGGSPQVTGSTHTSPVNVSAGPLAVGGLREISTCSSSCLWWARTSNGNAARTT